jgi:hypothetical protein
MRGLLTGVGGGLMWFIIYARYARKAERLFMSLSGANPSTLDFTTTTPALYIVG